MIFYKVIFEKGNRRKSKIVRNGELNDLIQKCHKQHYNIVNIEHA